MRVPEIRSIPEAIKIYYTKNELGTKDIKALFVNTMGHDIGSDRVAQLKKAAREKMEEDNVPNWNATKVNTEAAFQAWGLDIKKLEHNLNQLRKMGFQL